MIVKQFQGRMRMKIDTTANWAEAAEFIPLEGEILVYSDYATKEVDGELVNVPNFKVGDGLAYGIDLPFVGDDLRDELSAHLSDTNVHITPEERAFWNQKVRCYLGVVEDGDGFVINEENLVFTTD